MAVVFPCPSKVKCGPSAQSLLFGSFGVIDGNPNLDYDSPVTNVSTNRTDHPVYTAVGCAGLCVSLVSQEDANLCAEAMNALCGPLDGPNPPIYYTTGCLGLCVSMVSQADADACAAQMQAICNDSPGVIYTAQDCLGGTHVSLISQAQADAMAAAILCPPVPPTPPPIGGGGNGGPIGPYPPVPGFDMPVYYNFQQVCCQACPDGSSFCYAVGPGLVRAKTQQLADEVAYLMACSLAEKNIACLSAMTATNCCAGSGFDALIQFLGINYPYRLTVESGALPVGVAASIIGRGLIRVVGTPDAPGNYNFTLRITDRIGNHMSKSYTLNVVGISDDPILPNGNVGVAYAVQLQGAGGPGPWTFAVVGGSFPIGLSMDSAGLITGSPTQVETSTIIVQVSTTVGSATMQCTKEFTLEVKTAGVDWSQLVWDLSGDTVGTCPGASVSDTTSGPNINCSASGACGLGGGVCAAALPQGTMTYSGPQVQAHLSLTCVLAAGGGLGQFAAAAITILQDAVPLLNLPLVNLVNNTGEYDFTVSAGAGSTLSVVINCDACDAGDFASMVGLLT